MFKNDAAILTFVKQLNFVVAAAVGLVLLLASCASENHLDNPIDVVTDAAGTTFALTRGESGSYFIARTDTGEAFDIRQREAIDFDITPEGGFVVAGNGPDVLTWYDGVGSYIHRYPRQNEFGVVGGVAVDGTTLWVSDAKRGRVVAFDQNFEVIEVRTAGGTLNQPGAIAVGPDDSLWVYNSKALEIVLIDANDSVATRVDAPSRNPQETPRLSARDDGALLWSRQNGEIVVVSPGGDIETIASGFDQPSAASFATGNELAIVEGAVPRTLTFTAADTGGASSTATAAVLWGVRSLDANSTSTFRDPVMAVELFETQTQTVPSGGSWRELGIVGVTEIRGIAGAADGGAVVADLDGRVVWLDDDGRVDAVATLGGPSTVALTDLVVDRANRAWVVDAGNAQLHIVSADGSTELLEIDPRFLGNARGLGRSPNGQVWIASTASERLVEISQEGAVLQVIELPGAQPTDVAVAPDGSLWVVDGGPDLALLHLTSSGDELGRLALNGFTSIESPHLATWGSELFVTDPAESALRTVDMFTNEWSDQVQLLRRGDDARLDLAIGVGVDDQGRIWTVDSRAAATLRLEP